MMVLVPTEFDLKKEIKSIDFIVDNNSNIYYYELEKNNIILPIRYNPASEANFFSSDLLVFIPSYESYIAIIKSNNNYTFRSIEGCSDLADGKIECKEEYIGYIRKYLVNDEFSSIVKDKDDRPIINMDDIFKATGIELGIVNPKREETIHIWPISPLPMLGFYPFQIKIIERNPKNTIETYLGEEIIYINKKIIN